MNEALYIHLTPNLIQCIFTDVIKEGYLEYINSEKRSSVTSEITKKFHETWGLKVITNDRRRDYKG